MPENLNNIRVLSFGTVVDNEDPKMANRVRVSFDIEMNIALLNSIPNTYKGKVTKNDDNTDLTPEFKWSEIDLFCLLPLLPLFINLIPKVNESVQIIYPITSTNPRNVTHNEQYYVPAAFSSPLTMYYENNNSQRGFASKINIKNAIDLKNPINNEYNQASESVKGVFIEPEDIGLQGRGTTDVILKDNDVLIRSGKSNGVPDNKSKLITGNKSRSFIQLSSFNKEESQGTPIKKEVNQLNNDSVKLLIEWNILNPENQQDVFGLEIYLYKLKYNNNYSAPLFNLTTIVNESDKSLLLKYSYSNLSKFNLEQLVLKAIKDCNEGIMKMPNYPELTLTNQYSQPSNFPFYYRPSENLRKIIANQTPVDQYINIITISNNIEFLGQKSGYGLVSAKNIAGVQTITSEVTESQYVVGGNPITYNIHGADKLILLSHISTDKYQINWDDPTTLYGIKQSYIVNNILPKTSPMVRGDELMSFLNYLTRFLISHVHAFPGIPPVPTGTDGSTVSELLSKLVNADSTILNQNIRIN